MGSRVKAENNLLSIFIINFLFLIYLSIGCTTLFSGIGKIFFFKIGSLTIPSLLLFVLVCGLALFRQRFYFLFLVFIILSFPAPIDDIFPSVLVTNPDDRVEVFFPLITRIDIYLILGILIGSLKNGFKVKTIKLTTVLKLFFIFSFFIFVINTLKSDDLLDFNLLLAYSFHLRYFILFLVLLQTFDIKQFQKEIILGFVISLIFIYIEAHVNTIVQGRDRLLSGSLSLNTFANIFAAVGVFIIYLLKKKLINKWYGLLSLLIVLLILIGSETRGAILTIILTYFFLRFFENPRKFAINLLKIALGVIFAFSIYLMALQKGYIPERYSYKVIAEKVEIDLSKDDLLQQIEIKYSKETSSLKSRLELFNSSINMIDQNPITGIGVGRWNRYKNTYSGENKIPKVLLDSHNDYLALMSQYGIFLGLLFAFLIFIYPMRLSKKIKNYKSPLLYFYIINFAMGIAAFSNAGFFKHQVSAVLIFGLCVANNLYHKNAEA